MTDDLAERVERLEQESRLTKMVKLAAVEKRVARLQRENRFIKLAVLCALVALVASFLLGRGHQGECSEALKAISFRAGFPGAIRARSFQVVDENNETRAELSFFPEWNRFRIESLKEQLEDPTVDERSPGKEDILKWIEDLESQEEFAAVTLQVRGADGAGNFSVTAASDIAPRMMLSGEGGFVGLSPASLSMHKKDKGDITLSIWRHPSLRLGGPGSRGTIWLRATEEWSSLEVGEGILENCAEVKVTHRIEEMETPAPSISLHDKDGEVIWEAP